MRADMESAPTISMISAKKKARQQILPGFYATAYLKLSRFINRLYTQECHRVGNLDAYRLHLM